MLNTRNDTATASLKPIICTWPNLPASLGLPPYIL